MDRSLVLCTARRISRLALATALVIVVNANGPERVFAEGKSSGDPMASKLSSILALLRAPAKNSKPLGLEQVRAKYEADRKLSEAEIAMIRGDFERGSLLFDAGVALYRGAGLIDNDREFGVHYAAGLLRLLRKKYDEARGEFDQAIAIAEQTNGRESIEATDARLFLAIVGIQDDRDGAQARAAIEAALPIYRKLEKCDTAEYRNALQCLAVYALKQDQLTAVVVYQKELCDNLRESKVGAGSEALPENLAALGKVYIATKELPEARQCFDESAELYEKLRGRDDPLAKAAREWALKTAQLSTAVDDAHRIQLEWNKLEAQVVELQKAENYDATVPIMRRQIKLIRKVKGEQSDELLKCMQRLAFMLLMIDKLEDAATIYTELLKIADGWPKCSPEIKSSATFQLGAVELKLERVAEARTHLSRALDYYRSNPRESKTLRNIHLGLAMILLRSQEGKEALDHVEAAYGLLEGENATTIGSVLVSRATVACLCSPDQSLRERQQSILADCRARALAEFGDQDQVSAEVMSCVGSFQYLDNDPTCIEREMQATAIYGALLPADDRKTLNGIATIGKYCRAFGELDRARELLEGVLPKVRDLAEPEPHIHASVLRSLAGIDAHQGRCSSAEARYREAIAIMEKEDADDDQLPRDRQSLEALLAGKLPSLTPADNPPPFETKMGVTPATK